MTSSAATAEPRFAANSPHVVARIPSLATADPALVGPSDSPDTTNRLLSVWLSKKILAGGMLVVISAAVITALFQYSGSKTTSTAMKPPAPNAPEAPLWNGGRSDAAAQAEPRLPTIGGQEAMYGPSAYREPGDPIDVQLPGQRTASRSRAYDAPEDRNPSERPYVGSSRTARNTAPDAPSMQPNYAKTLDYGRDSESQDDARDYRGNQRNAPAASRNQNPRVASYPNQRSAPPAQNAESGDYDYAALAGFASPDAPSGSAGNTIPTSYQAPASTPMAPGARRAGNQDNMNPNYRGSRAPSAYPEAPAIPYGNPDPTSAYPASYPNTGYPAVEIPPINAPAPRYGAEGVAPANEQAGARFEGNLQNPSMRAPYERVR